MANAPAGFTGDFLFDVARGEVKGYSMLYKYGYNSTVDSDALDPIWEVTGAYPYRASGIAMYISGLAETGTYVFEGVDSDFEPITGYATATASGAGAATVAELLDSDGGTLLFYRVFRGWASGDTDPTGTVYVSDTAATLDSDGIPGANEIYAQVSSDFNQTMMALYTVPANHELYIFNLGGAITAETPAGISTTPVGLTVALRTRLNGGLWRVKETYSSITLGTNSFSENFTPRQGIPAGADVEMFALRATATVGVDARFWGVLRDLDLAP